jgi:hypothetical protein
MSTTSQTDGGHAVPPTNDDSFEKNLESQYATVKEQFPAEMRKEAYYGVLGDIVEAMFEQTEAPNESLLVHLITYLGNWLGRVPFTWR